LESDQLLMKRNFPLLKEGDLIVLINPPNKKIVLRDLYCSTITKGTYNWPNIDLLTISGILKKYFNVRLIDANTMGLSETQTIEQIVALYPKGIVFGFGVSVKEEDYHFVRKLREQLPDIKFCGTGGLLYYNSVPELEQHPEFDACLRNFTTDDVLKYFQDDYEEMNNITYRYNGDIIYKPFVDQKNDYSHPVPVHEHLPLKKFRLSHGKTHPVTSILTSWGCPAVCTFCIQENINYRHRSVDNIIEEMDHLKEIGVKEIFFRDGTFCASKKQGYALMNKMIKKNYGFSWVGNTRGDVITEETAQLMKQSGCHALHIGVETSNEEILKSTVKNITLDKIRIAFRICKENGIVTLGYFILGLPGETPEDLKRTINLAIELDCDYASFNMPFPQVGTSLRNQAIEQGWLSMDSKDGYDGSLTPIIETDTLSAKEIVRFKDLAFRKFYFRPRFIYKTVKRLRSMYQMRILLSEFKYFIKNRFA